MVQKYIELNEHLQEELIGKFEKWWMSLHEEYSNDKTLFKLTKKTINLKILR